MVIPEMMAPGKLREVLIFRTITQNVCIALINSIAFVEIGSASLYRLRLDHVGSKIHLRGAGAPRSATSAGAGCDDGRYRLESTEHCSTVKGGYMSVRSSLDDQ